ncbi:sensor histidine kinase [Rouxiella badensis]|jgi:two-component system sensor histidine kinase DcuS|uniref:sensor histidine kinase n=1 Tax=Rouxiella badensis TaxID=1646377 RepID=UPI0013EF58A7|nr:sensor histidine kinase [Rouxiella badensis]MCC3701605.1 sensor histidine kinase [Rouxiella badensis]MCC3734339.1 sensor histidine kinase [Rouxiella badensis]MCC3758877.1 sensor histidine kinase [Rouxiella badensis]QII38847.1 two-component system sensor histidine kinase DcuS [Rouxiella badensis]
MNQPLPQPARHKRPLKLSTLVSLMIGAVIITVLLSVHLLYYVQIENFTKMHIKDKAIAVARTLASSPEIQRGLTLPPDSGIIQPIAVEVQKRDCLLFIVVVNMQGIRLSHPNPDNIGKHFVGDDFIPALKGEENVSVNHGVLVEALRAFTPVYNAQHQQIGVVAVGISLDDVTQQINQSRWNIFWTVIFGALVGLLGILILVRRLKRILFGLEPHEISTLFEERQAILESIKEGVIAVDEHSRVSLINQAARQLLSETSTQAPLTGDVIPASSIMLSHLHDALHHGRAWHDEKLNVRGRTLISNTVPVRSGQRIIGAVCTFRDKTEISELMLRLDGMVNYVDILSERSHEFMNKLHVILGLLHMKNYSQLEAFILKTANGYQTEIGSLLQKIKSPLIAGFLLTKINRASSSGHRLMLSDASDLPNNGSEEQIAVLITVLGNLIENALEALGQQSQGEIHVLLHYQNGWLACEVSDDGPGIPAEQLTTIFEKGVSSKGSERGVGLFLVRQQIDSLGGNVTVESEPGVYTQFLVQLPWGRGVSIQ